MMVPMLIMLLHSGRVLANCGLMVVYLFAWGVFFLGILLFESPLLNRLLPLTCA